MWRHRSPRPKRRKIRPPRRQVGECWQKAFIWDVVDVWLIQRPNTTQQACFWNAITQVHFKLLLLLLPGDKLCFGFSCTKCAQRICSSPFICFILGKSVFIEGTIRMWFFFFLLLLLLLPLLSDQVCVIMPAKCSDSTRRSPFFLFRLDSLALWSVLQTGAGGRKQVKVDGPLPRLGVAEVY